MTAATNKALALEALERGFNQGDLSVWDELVAEAGADHQEAPGKDFRAHLKEVVVQLRGAFPDLHFEVHHALAEGDLVALHSTMTGTHRGAFAVGPFRDLPPTGKTVRVRHMHFLRWQDGYNTDLWHLWDTASLARQLGLTPERTPVGTAPQRT